jgi:hypothetical protein
MQAARPRPLLPLLTSALLLVSATLLVAACRREAPAPDPAAAVAAQVARERAASMFAQDRLRAALEAIQPLLAVKQPDPQDRLRAAIIHLALNDRDPALAELQAAAKVLDDSPALHFNLGRLYFDSGEGEQALVELERAHDLAPDDIPTKLRLAQALADRVYDASEAEAERLTAAALEHYQALRERGVEFAGSWFLPILQQYANLLMRSDQVEAADALFAERDELLARGITNPSSTDLQRGNFGRLDIPRPTGSRAPTLAAPTPTAGAEIRSEGPVRQLARVALEERWHPLSGDRLTDKRGLPEGRDPASVVLDFAPSAPETLWIDGRGLVAQRAGGRQEVLVPGAVEAFAALDLGEDKRTREVLEGQLPDGRAFIKDHVLFTDAELAVVQDGRLRLFSRPDYWESGPYEQRLELDLPLAGPTRDLCAWDYDHDGDLDLALCGAYGARFLRNDGVDGSGTFADDSASFGIPAGFECRWLLPEDLDSDQDVDLLIGGPSGALWFDSLRGGRFADASARLPAGQDWSARPLAADFDADFFVDLFLPASGQILGNAFGTKLAPRGPARAARPGQGPALLADLDLSGAVDLAWLDGAGALQASFELGTEGERPAQTLVPARAELGAPAGLALGPGPELTAAFAAGLLPIGLEAAGGGFTLALKGVKDTAHGLGALVELRAGPIYRRVYWRDETLTLGLGDQPRIDVLRVTWPNGVIQSQVDLPAGAGRTFEQIEGLVGSCPFLYAWNGEQFEFISDVLGITPLGLPIAPGVFVPPDHDEYVLVRGDQLAPKDGLLTLQFTEELREVTYLDQVRLFAVDHAPGVEIFPNERFTFPPFPEEHLYTIADSAAPLAALDDTGRDWAGELAAIDGRFAEPFVPHRGQYMGLADPYTLTLRFDPAAIAAAKRPRLVATGWFYWSDASVNMAIARHPDWEFVPPILEVPDGQGGWRPLGPPVGFPAGKTKTMVIELAGALDPADPRLRLSSTLRLYWDRLILATCGDDAPAQRHEAPLASAKLWERGFSRRVTAPGQDPTCSVVLLEWFDWHDTEEQPRWNMHPGLYTKLGETKPLLGEIDDRFVILGAGDALTLEFDARALPPLAEGLERDYLVFFDGWAKDRDPNTSEALYVTPLPFHGMSGYPYRADESYPDTPATREFRREWLTREAKRWIEPLAPDLGAAKRGATGNQPASVEPPPVGTPEK